MDLELFEHIKDKNQMKLKHIILALYLSLGPVVWFSDFTLGGIKRVLLVLLVFLYVPVLFKSTNKISGLWYILMLLLVLTISLIATNTLSSENTIDTYLGIIENYICFVIGYISMSEDVLSNKKFVRLLLLIPILTCFLTITNFLFSIPNWIAPTELSRSETYANVGYEVAPLWKTGFSWGRNGWAGALSVILPISLFLKNNRYITVVWIVIGLSILLSGSRNGVVAIITTFVIWEFFMRGKTNFSFGKIILLFAIIASVIGVDVLFSRFLDSEDISAGRFEQYDLIPQALSEIGFWGMGMNGSYNYLYAHGAGMHALHNAYVRVFIDYGFLVGFIVMGLMIFVIGRIIYCLRTKDKESSRLAIILMIGLMLAMFEPTAMLGSLGAYSIWWFTLGCVLQNNKKNRYASVVLNQQV